MSLNLLVVGRDGNGKSSTGNSILGDKFFKPSSTTTNSKVKIERNTSTIDGREVLVMEVSGLEYPSVEIPENAEDTVKSINDAFEDIKQALTDEPDGFQAMLICIKYGIRFTKQEEEAIEMIKATFGPKVIEDYGVIVMTYGDSFKLDIEDEKKSFEEWCAEQTGKIQTLFGECNKRCVLFNNRTKEEGLLKQQRDKLVSFVNEIKSKTYTFTNFEDEEVVLGHDKVLLTSRLPFFEEQTRIFLNNTIENFKKESVDYESLLELSQKWLELYKNNLQEEDKGTSILKPLINELSITETYVVTKIQIFEQNKKILKEQESWQTINTDDGKGCEKQSTPETDMSASKCQGGLPASSSNSGDGNSEGNGEMPRNSFWDNLKSKTLQTVKDWNRHNPKK